MKKIIVVGLGNFGVTLAKQLESNGCEVLGIDLLKENIENCKDYISHAVIGNAADKELMDALMINDFDSAVVGIGQDMNSSILISLYFIEIGIKNVITRALSPDHAKILEKIGVNEIINPEIEIAKKLANKLSMKNALDYLPLSEEHGIIEVSAPQSFIGHTLKDLQIASRFNCQLIAIKNISHGKETIKIPPTADDVIAANSIMIIIGKLKDIEKIQNLK